ncbi:MAG: phosphoribosylformylglycinamidine synthase subunit PurQ [Phycisphaerales bacterium]|nr:phosphoribosylformylglycinamidine synthase subunit PurQ [Phycisphaerales bacterium]
MNPNALVITAPGINCDLELAQAFETAGARVESIPLVRLSRDPGLIDRFELIGLPGGFSYGDDVAAGRVLATLIRRSIYPALCAAIERGCPMIAPCNGFQVAVQVGLLPGPADGEGWSTEPPTPTVSLATNQTALFTDCWTPMEVDPATHSVWTRGIDFSGEAGMLPSAHGEGRFAADEELLDALEASGRVVLRYAEGSNFNGSLRRIAGICDASGLVLGLMPHPERFTRWTQHPRWTRMDAATREQDPPGLAMFRNAVRHASGVPV